MSLSKSLSAGVRQLDVAIDRIKVLIKVLAHPPPPPA
jgi:hypothetical protein